MNFGRCYQAQGKKALVDSIGNFAETLKLQQLGRFYLQRFGKPFSSINTKGANDMEIKVQKLGQEELNKMGVFTWPIWTKEVSRFDWRYDSVEECYILEGEVVVESKDGKKVSFGKGDFVTFPKGLSCVWDIKKPVRKHYNFR